MEKSTDSPVSALFVILNLMPRDNSDFGGQGGCLMRFFMEIYGIKWEK
jgi:hypothetical protein